ncbi:glycoside hydrolase family 2 TIM barrel-domain containing protein [Candidatus Epulonipiscium viviparus]|uniref:glycoside hydrolase family 2 TIM barrel-domain containing protein n=1 Tax=Candidatus Epulonipiscium viviparus TaxID=420336 RepID=UPI0027381511|nr:glycoside hydrolase family 2 TIM barrel-domain containing protein [Candidatus Epulopiscium viviparus]
MRQILNMDFDWKFHDGDIVCTNFNSVHEIFENPSFMKSANCGISKVGYNLHKWDDIKVPHDFRHYKSEFSENAVSSQGYLTTGIAWYRKEFFVPAETEGKSITVEFDGIFRDSEVYVNGSYVGNHLSGYTSFSYDISDFILYGENNAIAVRVDATKYEGWWYEGAGIYRDVRLVIADRLKVKYSGVFVKSEVRGNAGGIEIDVELENEAANNGDARLVAEILSPCGEKVGEFDTTIKLTEYEETCATIKGEISNICLWELDSPKQYKAVISVYLNDQKVDEYTQKFGFRTIAYTVENGFVLNGKPTKLQGVCVHDDFAGVGGAMSRSVIRHKIFLLKQWGANAYRSSHNPPSPYLLEACDDFGILVMDEVRLMSSSKEFLGQMTDLIKRDRNHPSVFIWSIGNEEMAIHGRKVGVKIGNHMLRVAHKLDPTRACTYANNGHWHDITIFHEQNGLHMDVYGFNYYCLRTFDMYERFHKKYPDKMIIGTENGSALSTRGQYLPRKGEDTADAYTKSSMKIMIWSNPERLYNISAYGEAYTTWGATPLETFRTAEPNYVSGYFLWTGFDYRGEVVPLDWPSTITRFGLIDLCGFTKDLGHHCRVKWSQEPAIHLYPHWTFDDNVGELEVDMVANTEEVELIVNGNSYGRVENPKWDIVKNFVKYEKGEITAIGYNNGVEVIRTGYKTAGKPAKINLEIVQPRDYVADGEDNVFVKVDVLDENGIHCPNADTLISFEVTGDGEFLGCGNGDPLDLAHEMNPSRNLFNGLALVIMKTKRHTGKMKLVAKSFGLESAEIEVDVTIPATDVLVESARSKTKPKAAEPEKDAADNAF